jgi:hypothetical protein
LRTRLTDIMRFLQGCANLPELSKE